MLTTEMIVKAFSGEIIPNESLPESCREVQRLISINRLFRKTFRRKPDATPNFWNIEYNKNTQRGKRYVSKCWDA